jgi:hypothetical protein
LPTSLTSPKRATGRRRLSSPSISCTCWSECGSRAGGLRRLRQAAAEGLLELDQEHQVVADRLGLVQLRGGCVPTGSSAAGAVRPGPETVRGLRQSGSSRLA